MSERKSVPIGSRFSRWTVIGDPVSIKSRVHLLCRCDCGTERVIASTQLRFGKSHSCGCFNLERITKHGAAKRGQMRSEYATWLQMRHRCRNSNDAHYADYGGRGIRVCESWNSFDQFLADMGPRPSGYSLDRINNDGNYEPSNCRWASDNTQIRNRRNNRNITLNGVTLCLSDWAKKLGVPITRLQYRYEKGMTDEEILSPENRRTRCRIPSQPDHRR